MSVKSVYVAQISTKLEQLFGLLKVGAPIADTDSEKAQKLKSRYLAAFAILNTTNADELSSAESVVDGGGDNGIDAIYFDRFQKTLVVVQAKWKNSGIGCPQKSDVILYCNGVKDLLSFNREKFKNISDEKWETISDALGSPGVTIEMVLAYTANEELPSEQEEVINSLLLSVNDDIPLLKSRVVRTGDIFSWFENSDHNEISATISIRDWGLIKEPHRSYYGKVLGAELSKLWGIYGDRLFEANLRRSLKSSINESITDTAINDSENFWYFNNGVTVVCSRIEKSPGGDRDFTALEVTNLAIVNGAQTVTSLGRCGTHSKLEKVWVHVRFIEVGKDFQGFGDMVTHFNNYQNRIEPRDLMAQNKQQRRLKRDLMMLDYTYRVQQGEYRENSEWIDFEEATLALCCSSEDSDMAVIAQREIGVLWSNNAVYQKIFNDSVSGIEVINKVLIYRQINIVLESIRGNDEIFRIDKSIIASGRRILVHLIFYSLRRNGDFVKSDQLIDVFEIKEKIREQVYVNLLKIRNYASQHSGSLILAVSFKNRNFVRKLRDYCLLEQRNFSGVITGQMLLEM